MAAVTQRTPEAPFLEAAPVESHSLTLGCGWGENGALLKVISKCWLLAGRMEFLHEQCFAEGLICSLNGAYYYQAMRDNSVFSLRSLPSQWILEHFPIWHSEHFVEHNCKLDTFMHFLPFQDEHGTVQRGSCGNCELVQTCEACSTGPITNPQT